MEKSSGVRRQASAGVGRDLDEAAMTELELYIDNDGDLYRQRTQPIEKNLYLKITKGTYSKQLAPKLWGHLVEAGAKKYAREFSAPQRRGGFVTSSEWTRMFPKAERDALAAEYARRFERAVENGEYRHLEKTLPKKFRRNG